MAGLVDQRESAPGAADWFNSHAQFHNNVPLDDPNDPIVAAAALFDGRALPDRYVLTFPAVDALAHLATVHVEPDAPNNPFRTGGDRPDFTNVPIDGVTVRKDIIPGIGLILSGSALFSTIWEGEVLIGKFWGTLPSFGPSAGVATASERHRVLNEDAGAAAECKARLLTTAYYAEKSGSVFDLIKPAAEDAIEKVAGGGSERVMPYVIEITHKSGGLFGFTVDGAGVTVRNLNTGATVVSNSGAVIDPAVHYKIISGGATSVEFKMNPAAIITNVANVMIYAPRDIEICGDAAGSPNGDWGTDDVILTQAGQPAGVIQGGGVAFFHIRAKVPEGQNAESNPLLTFVYLEGLQTGQAGYFA